MTAFLLGVAPSNDAESDGKWITFNGHKMEQYYYDTSNDSVSDLPWYEEILLGTVTGGVGGTVSRVIKKGFDDVVTSAGKYFAKGTGKGNFTYNNLPKSPDELVKNGWKDVTPQGMRKNTNSREYMDPKSGMKVRFEPGKPGAKGYEGKDHYHIYNPNSTGKGDYYLDINGTPVPKGSKASHLLP